MYNQFFVMLATSTICHLAFRLGLLLIGLRNSRGYVCEPAAPELSANRQLYRSKHVLVRVLANADGDADCLGCAAADSSRHADILGPFVTQHPEPWR